MALADFTGAVLHTRLANTLAKIGVQEGLVRVKPLVFLNRTWPEVPGGDDELEAKQYRIAQAAVQTPLDIDHTHKTLEAILLFGKAFVPENMFIDFGPLRDEGLVECTAVKDYDEEWTFDLTSAQLWRPLHTCFEWTYFRRSDTDFARHYDTYLAVIRDIQMHGSRDLPRTLREKYESQLGRPFVAVLASLHIFMLSVQDVENYVDDSSALGAALVFEEPAVEISPHLSDDDAVGPDVLRTYRIYLSELTSLPKLQSIADLTRLLKDPALQDLRSAISVWTAAIRQGDVESEARFRTEIRRARAGLAKSVNSALSLSG